MITASQRLYTYNYVKIVDTNGEVLTLEDEQILWIWLINIQEPPHFYIFEIYRCRCFASIKYTPTISISYTFVITRFMLVTNII